MLEKHLTRPCWLEIDLDILRDNYHTYERMLDPGVMIMPAVKANAYGHGILEVSRVFESCGASRLGVGTLDEAMLLRKNGIKLPLLIFASNTIMDVADIYIEYDLIPTVTTVEQAAAMSQAAGGRPVAIFLKIETGRGRLGVNAEEMPAFVKALAVFPNLRIEGMYTHVAAANWPDIDAYTPWQHSRFTRALEEIEKSGVKIPFLQMLNSTGAVAHPDMRMTAICPGHCLYGLSSLEARPEHPKFARPFTAWKSRLLMVKDVIAGRFGPKFDPVVLDTPKRIGVMAGGTCDSIHPLQAKGGHVLLRGKKTPVVGPISLEHSVLDLTECPEAEIGDEAVIMGKQGNEEIIFEDLLQRWNKSATEFLATLTPALPRVYYSGNRPVRVTHMTQSRAIG